MTEKEIIDKELPWLEPPDVKIPTRRLGAVQDIGILCIGECGDLKNEVRAYDLLELFATLDFYERISEHPELMRLLPNNPVLGSYHINETRRKYFAAGGTEVPEKSAPEYAAYEEANPENRFFDFLVKEGELVRTYIRSDKRPQTPEEFDTRMREVLPERYYLQILCCDAHQEATIRHAINETWHDSFFDIEAEDIVHQGVADHSLIYAPQRRQEPRVLLSKKIAEELLPRAEQTRDFFYSVVNSQFQQKN